MGLAKPKLASPVSNLEFPICGICPGASPALAFGIMSLPRAVLALFR